MLQRAVESDPNPAAAALLALALLRLGRPGDARWQLDSALRDYCVDEGGLLGMVATHLIQDPAIAAPGWFGQGRALDLVGQISPHQPISVVDIQLDAQPPFSQMLPGAGRNGRTTFTIPLPRRDAIGSIVVSHRNVPLLGSGLRIPSHFGLDGRCESRGRRLSGWAQLGWAPAHRVRLQARDENGDACAVPTARSALPGGRWPFELDLRAQGLSGQRIEISARLPDGRWQPLPDAPLLLEPAARLAGPRPKPLPKWPAGSARRRVRRALSQNTRKTDVIIPVYRGREATLACLESVLATIDTTAHIVVVDDASDDAALASGLDELAAQARITLLRNGRNLGFVASVNRALALNPTHDAVLLNSDTRVFDDWLARLRAAAYSAVDVGTVTPLSNSGSIASYPHPRGSSVDLPDGATLHALAASTHSGVRLAIPVGVGFCLYLRRDCLNAVGAFDEAVFGAGYGEETDFCLRSRRRGWSHQLAADVFVYHAGGLSFGGRRAALLDRSQRLINLRHPGYDSFIASFLAQDPMHGLRRRLDERRLAGFDGRFVLLVTLNLAGGVDRFVAERCRQMRAQGLHPLVLRPSQAGEPRECELWTDALEVPSLRYGIPADLVDLTAMLGALDLAAIEIQHFLHLDPRVIEAVRALPVPYDAFVHDYAWICPRVTLIDGSGRYCGEPAVSVCERCVRRHGSNLGEKISVPALRERSAAWLRAARRVLAPSADTAERLKRHFRGLEVLVQPHRAAAEPIALPPRPAGRRRLRVALIGAIGEHKGYEVLLACARDAARRRLPLEFVVIGYTQDDAALIATGRVFITGRYTEGEAPYLLGRERPDVAWLPSVWPETWSYTLDYALGLGVPVVAFDLGAIAERLRTAGGGTLLPLALDPRRINDRLLQLGHEPIRPIIDPRSVQTFPDHGSVDAKMQTLGSDQKMMAKNAPAKPAPAVAEEPLSAAVQVLPLPAGLYLFSVKAAAPVRGSVAGQLSLPAVHVGLGPGVRPEQVEFMAGPSTHGAWLFAPGDLLVTRITGGGATLILSSLRAPGGEVLSIKVERLDARAEGSAGVSPTGVKTPTAASASQATAAVANGALPLHIAAHVRTRGDMTFRDVPWAGRVAPGLWIESFAVRPLEHFGVQDIEYKGLTGTGFETPWLSDEKMCGTKGMAVPLVGFAVRLKPSAAAAAFDCEYSGYFQSGVTVGPLRNGAPCRSTVANDPLEGIQLRVVRRAGAAAEAAKLPKDTKKTPARSTRGSARPTRRPATRRP